MPPSSPLRSLAATSLWLLALALIFVSPLHAQVATGSIEGRVLHAASGRYLDRVRVTVEGTLLETFTDELGAYRVDGVPARWSVSLYLCLTCKLRL